MMTDVITAAPAAAQAAVHVTDRRRPGRLENPSPELIALMRKPTPEAVRGVALYDAPNFVLPEQPSDFTGVSLLKLGRFAAAFGICAAGWVAAFKIMMVIWG